MLPHQAIRSRLTRMVLVDLAGTAIVYGFLTASPRSTEDARFAATVVTEVMNGHLSGEAPARPNHADFSILQPGDVIVCHNPEGSYGYWTHAVLYTGDGKAMDSCDFVYGTTLMPLAKYHHYAQVLILRPHLPTSARRAVVQTALRETGKPYDPFEPLSDRHSQYCTKLIWQVFRAHGLPVCPAKRWLVPDDLARSRDFTHITPPTADSAKIAKEA
ncbi:MAG: hypothetical protein K6T30_10435 [Alicyclobacillus sp.]|nr:hypothetical protein [Alicyclobacillus sp.]